jgi:hypothetical protein
VQFTGGDSVEMRLDQSKIVPTEDVRKSVNKLAYGEALIGYQTELGTGVKNPCASRFGKVIDKNTGRPVTNAVDPRSWTTAR